MNLFFNMVLVSGLLCSSTLFAATFNVTNSDELNSALSTASSNNEDNTINLAAGTYTSTGGFSYAPTAINHSLTLLGSGSDSTIVTATAGVGLSFTFSGQVNVGSLQVLNSSDKGMSFADDADGTQFDVTISDCLIKNNHNSGVSISSDQVSGSVTVNNSDFEENASTAKGGGLYIFGNLYNSVSMNVTLTDSNFDSNQASDAGGGLYVYVGGTSSAISIKGSTFENNTSLDTGGGAYIDNSFDGGVTIGGVEEGEGNTFNSNTAYSSGGVYLRGYGGLSFVGNEVTDNMADVSGGSSGGVRYEFVDGHGEFSNNVIQNNTSASNGGVEILTANGGSSATFNMNANLISGNTANLDNGGGLLNFPTLTDPAVITNNIIANNSATTGNASTGGLSIAVTDDEDVYIINNTFSGNDAEFYFVGGLMLSPGNASSTYNLINNIFWDNTTPYPAQDVYVYTTTFSAINLYNNELSSVCVDDGMGSPLCNSDDDFSDVTGVNVADNIVGVDPLFVATGDLLSDYFYLQASSPAIAQGIADNDYMPETDYTGTTLLGGTPDLGALQLCSPQIHISIDTVTEEAQIGELIVWHLTISNDARCLADNNTLTLTFHKSNYYNVDESSRIDISNVFKGVADSNNISCSGSGTTATCSISGIDYSSSVSITAEATAVESGEVSLTASFSNSLGTATATGTASSTVLGVAGGGCSLMR